MLPCKSCSVAYLSGAHSFNTFPNLEVLTSKLLSPLALHSQSPLAELKRRVRIERGSSPNTDVYYSVNSGLVLITCTFNSESRNIQEEENITEKNPHTQKKSVSILIGSKKRKKTFKPKPACSVHNSKLTKPLCNIAAFRLSTEDQHIRRHYCGARPVKTQAKQSSYLHSFHTAQRTSLITRLHHCTISPFSHSHFCPAHRAL